MFVKVKWPTPPWRKALDMNIRKSVKYF